MAPRRSTVLAAPRLALADLDVLVLGAVAATFTRHLADSAALDGAAVEACPNLAMGHGCLELARRRAGDHEAEARALRRASELDHETRDAAAKRAALARYIERHFVRGDDLVPFLEEAP